MKKKMIAFIIVQSIILAFCSCGSHESEKSGIMAATETEDIQEPELVTEQMEAPTKSDDLIQSDYNQKPDELLDTEEVIKVYDLDIYGTIEEVRQEFLEEESGEVSYYYEMEKFYLNDTLPNSAAINDTLRQIYDKYEATYVDTAEVYGDVLYENANIPYQFLHLINIYYVGEDYISILYNDVSYMGGAHPYSMFDGITIDCKTGDQIFASQFLDKSEDTILADISEKMALDVVGTWDDIDFYITDDTIVFFYRIPNFWDDVILPRK